MGAQAGWCQSACWPPAERRRQPRIGGPEERHRRHPDRGGDVGGPAVRTDERVELPDERGQEMPDGPGRRDSGSVPPAAAWTASASLARPGTAEEDRVDAARHEPRRQRGDARGGPELGRAQRRSQLEPDARLAQRHPASASSSSRRASTRRAGSIASVGGAGDASTPKGASKLQVFRHLVDPTRSEPAAACVSSAPGPSP